MVYHGEEKLSKRIEIISKKSEVEISEKLEKLKEYERKINLLEKNDPDYFKELREYVKSFEDIIIEEKER